MLKKLYRVRFKAHDVPEGFYSLAEEPQRLHLFYDLSGQYLTHPSKGWEFLEYLGRFENDEDFKALTGIVPEMYWNECEFCFDCRFWKSGPGRNICEKCQESNPGWSQVH